MVLDRITERPRTETRRDIVEGIHLDPDVDAAVERLKAVGRIAGADLDKPWDRWLLDPGG
jgi:hypothetical protein